MATGRGEHGAHVVEQAEAFRHFLRPGPQLAALGEVCHSSGRMASASVDPDAVHAVWEDAAGPDWAGPRLRRHCDLHPADVLTTNGTFSGVIDFGDRPPVIKRGRPRRAARWGRAQTGSFVSMTKLISMTWPGKVSSVTPKTVLTGR